VNEQGVALRVAAAPVVVVGKGRESGGLSVSEFERRLERKVVLSCLAVESRCFKGRRDREARGEVEEKGGEKVVVTEQEVLEETRRRREMAALKRELYGAEVGREGKLAMDPEWDGVEPVMLEEPEGALATIAYPAEYAEGEFSLVAVVWPMDGRLTMC
jgi:protein farnesyltransferase/geranylgeranyltransferase type-1 subunit alpha